jgi:hypothetical protein
MTGDHGLDPRGLIAEAYRIDGITPAECRSIFLDWAIETDASRQRLESLLARHAGDAPDHPMTAILIAAMAAPAPRPSRQGGAGGRRKAR